MRIAIGLALLALAILALACGSSDGVVGQTPLTTQSQPTPRQTCVIVTPGAPPVCVTQEVNGSTCGPNGDHIPFFSKLILPAQLPAGMSLTKACSTTPFEGIAVAQEFAELIYANQSGDKNLHVSTGNGSGIVPVQQRGRPAIQLGSVVGYVTNTARADGTTLYSVEFEKNGRAYTVIAILGTSTPPLATGPSPIPESPLATGASPAVTPTPQVNTLTPDDLNAVALSMAQS